MKTTPLESWIEHKIKCPVNSLSRQRIDDFQLTKINETLSYAKMNSSFYRDLLKSTPSTINSLDDFSNIPFTSADDLRKDPSGFVCVSQNAISRVVTLDTSGTTGQPKRCFFTPEDQNLTIDFFGVGMSNLVSVGDRVLILLPDRLPSSVGDLLYRGLIDVGVTAHKHGPVHDLDETLRTICLLDINCLVGTPTQVLALVRYQQMMPEMFPVKMKSILLSTDYVPEAIVTILKNSWHCEVFNHYGTTEMGLGGGVFCEGQYGYHLREADMYFEVIDTLSGHRLPDGEMGEVVFTTLTRQGMPLIRYRTGDYSRFLPDPCPCGTILKSLQKINGRLDQHFQINGQSYLISDIDEALFPLAGLINYQLTINHEKNTDSLVFTVYFLNDKKRTFENEVTSALLEKEIISANQSILFNPIDGYPEELWSLRKRKVTENFI